MTVTLAAALAGVWRVATAVERVATRVLPDADPAPRLAARLTLAAMVVFLLGAWAWLDPVLVRARFGVLGRFAALSLCCLACAMGVAAAPVLWVGFFALMDVRGASSALTVVLVTPVVPLVVWVPAFWSGELVGVVAAVGRRARRGRPGAVAHRSSTTTGRVAVVRPTSRNPAARNVDSTPG